MSDRPKPSPAVLNALADRSNGCTCYFTEIIDPGSPDLMRTVLVWDNCPVDPRPESPPRPTGAHQR